MRSERAAGRLRRSCGFLRGPVSRSTSGLRADGGRASDVASKRSFGIRSSQEPANSEVRREHPSLYARSPGAEDGGTQQQSVQNLTDHSRLSDLGEERTNAMSADQNDCSRGQQVGYVGRGETHPRPPKAVESTANHQNTDRGATASPIRRKGSTQNNPVRQW
jgi:hypothetical protein